MPLFGTYESSLSLALAVLAGAAVVRLRAWHGPAGWCVPAGITAGVIAHGLGYDKAVYALTISERS